MQKTSRKKKIAQLQAIPVSGFVFDPDTHTYLYDGKQMTGVTTILGVLSKPALIQWAANMAINNIRDSIVLNAVSPAMFPAQYQNDTWYVVSDKQLEQARTAHAKFRDKRASEGTDVHGLVEEYVKWCIEKHGGKPEDIDWDVNKTKQSIIPFVQWAQTENIRFLSSEQQFYSTNLFVAGTADIIFEKDGKRYVGDIKNKKKIYGRDAYFQCAGYSILAEDMGEPHFDGYCVIRLWENELEVVWSGDTHGDREGFLACVKLYRLINA